jgi:hypothetical protein
VNIDDVVLVDDLYEYQDRPFTGRAREYSPDGVLIGELDFVDGMLDGDSRGWYPSGQLKDEEHFRANGRHGLAKEWYESGKAKRETLFEHSIVVRDREWDENGNVIRDYVLDENAPQFKRLEARRRASKSVTGAPRRQMFSFGGPVCLRGGHHRLGIPDLDSGPFYARPSHHVSWGR